jgi:hypothetical protein
MIVMETARLIQIVQVNVAGGSAVVDECGECDGNGADVMCEDGSYVCDAADCDTGGDWDGDACSMPDHSIHITSGGSVLYNSSSGIAGFQFDVDGATVLSASGGNAEEAGFMISANETTVLGFSLSGATFEGCGTMIELELDGEATGLSGIIVSDSDGVALPFEYFDGSGGGDDPTVLEITYNTDTPIAGFQFNVTGVTITEASGGAAEDAGFMISSSASTVVAFSLSGATVPSVNSISTPLPDGIVAPLKLKATTVDALEEIIKPASSAAPPEASVMVTPVTLN